MGNYISCALSGSSMAKQTSRGVDVKVIFPNGEIQQFNQQEVKAAEIMFETPGFFLTNVNSLHIGRRFSALNADEDLEMANVYIMFPMKRVNSFVTPADMGVLFLAANSAGKRASSLGPVKILPEYDLHKTTDEVPQHKTPPPSSLPKLNLDDIEEFTTPEFKHRLTMCRSKKPLLETIAEEPHYTR